LLLKEQEYAGGMSPMVMSLPSKCEALSSNPSITRKKKFLEEQEWTLPVPLASCDCSPRASIVVMPSAMGPLLVVESMGLLNLRTSSSKTVLNKSPLKIQ
jgi:hypothetical protein